MIKVVFPFDAVTNSQLRKIRPRGVYRSVHDGWEFPFAAAKILLEILGSRFLVKQELGEWLSWVDKPLPPMPKHRHLVEKADLEMPLKDGRVPLPHQRSGARWLLARRGAVLADEMGLGKTLTALLAARGMFRCVDARVMVVAPAGLHSFWRKEAQALNLPIFLESWAKLPTELPSAGTILLVDEAHFAQSMHAVRTQRLLRLARHPRLRAIWMLTGTPIKNGRPVQLYPLLAAIDHPLALDQRLFEERFCGGHWRSQGENFRWDCRGASNLDELRNFIKPLVLTRRKNCLLTLPPKYRREHIISLTTSEARGFDHRLNLIIEDYRDRVRQGLVQSDAESLAILTAIRQISAEFKLPAVTALLIKLISKGESVVVFSSFVEPLLLLQKRIGGGFLIGRQSFDQREESVSSFQNGLTSVLYTTYAAGGLGFTLHRARHVILLERPWTPGDVEQAEDRCHRLGMDGSLTSHWFKLGFADDLIDALVATKAQRIEVLLGSRRLGLKRQSLPLMLRCCLQEP